MNRPAQEVVEEALWVLRCRMGDSSTFLRLFERYRGPILYFVRQMLSHVDEADDVSQEVWLKAYRSLRKLRDVDRFRPWLYRIARNEVLQTLRRLHREPERLDDVPAEPMDEPEEPYRPEEAEAVNRMLERLSPSHREALILFFLHDMTYEEIAEATDCSVGTVRSRLHYAKKALREELEAEIHGPDSEFAKRLMQEGGVLEAMPAEEMRMLNEKIVRQERTLKRLKIEGIVILCLWIAAPTALGILTQFRQPGNFGPLEGLVLGVTTSWWIVVLFGISYIVRKHFLNQRRIEAAMLRMATELAAVRSSAAESK